MSHSSARKKVLNESIPLEHRASHARSCINHIASRIGIGRTELMAMVLKETSVDLNAPKDAEELMTAFHYVEGLHACPITS